MKRLSLVASSFRNLNSTVSSTSSTSNHSDGNSTTKPKKGAANNGGGGLHLMDVPVSSQVSSRRLVMDDDSSRTSTSVRKSSKRTSMPPLSTTARGRQGKTMDRSQSTQAQPTRQRVTRQRSSSLSKMERRKTGASSIIPEERPVEPSPSSVSTNWAKSSSDALERIAAQKQKMADNKKKKRLQKMEELQENHNNHEKENGKVEKIPKTRKSHKAKPEDATIEEELLLPTERPGKPKRASTKGKHRKRASHSNVQEGEDAHPEEMDPERVGSTDAAADPSDTTDAATALSAFLELIAVSKEEVLSRISSPVEEEKHPPAAAVAADDDKPIPNAAAEFKPPRRRKKLTRQRSRSLTSMGRPFRGTATTTTGGRRPTRFLQESDPQPPPPKPKPKRTFVFDDDYQDDPMVKLDAKVVALEVEKWNERVQELQQQLLFSDQQERKQIREQEAKCRTAKEAFVQKMRDATEDSNKEDLSDAVIRTKELIASLKTENARCRRDNQKLKLELFDLHQKTQGLESATNSVLQYVQELEEVHLVHEQDKNQVLHNQMRMCQEGHEKLVAQLERRELYGEMEHRVRERYERAIDDIQQMLREKRGDEDKLVRAIVSFNDWIPPMGEKEVPRAEQVH